MRRVRVKRYRAGSWNEQEEIVAEEALVEVLVNGELLSSLVCTPSHIRELVYGHLAGRGLIRTAQEVKEYQEEWDFSGGIPGEQVRVRVKLGEPLPDQSAERLLWSGCGTFLVTRFSWQKLSPRPLFSGSRLLDLPKIILSLAQGFKQTGAQHSALLCDRNLTVLFFAEDIGRHNAVDKVVGAALLAEKSLAEGLLYTTGRIGVELVLKALHVGLPMVISPSAPLWGAVALARQHNLGLIGFLRGQRFNLYSGEGWLTP